MNVRRIRQVNVLELDQAMYNSTYQVGLELANWLNASMNICMLETKEQGEFIKAVYGDEKEGPRKARRNQIDGIINDVKVKGELIDFGYSVDHFDENDSIKEIFGQLTIDESLSILGYNKSLKHKQVLKKLLNEDLGNPLMLIPMDKQVKTFHRLIVPFEPEYVTKRKLSQLKWYTEQLGVMIDFVHFKSHQTTEEKMKLREIYEVIYYWVEDLQFSNKVNFRFPTANNLNEGLIEYLKNEENYLLCVIDSEIKKAISTSHLNKTCLMDIKEPLVII